MIPLQQVGHYTWVSTPPEIMQVHKSENEKLSELTQKVLDLEKEIEELKRLLTNDDWK